MRSWPTFLLLAALALLVYLPVWNKPFAADDYPVLYRILYQGSVLEEGFFRPVSDISLYGTYLLSGLQPVGFNLFNILVHAFNAFVLFRVTRLLPIDPARLQATAWLAALFFLLYPYHNETVVWGVGRASLLSATMAFLALWLALSFPTRNNAWWAAGMFFLSLSSYETSVLLPLIVALLLYWKKYPPNIVRHWLLVLTGALLANLAIRKWIVAEIVGGYASRLLEWQPQLLFPKILKVFGRYWLPPTSASWLFVGGTVLVILGLGLYFTRAFRRSAAEGKGYLIAFTCFLLAGVLSFLFGVSTRTIEGDRVMYLASWFLCLFLGLAIGQVTRAAWRNTLTVVTLLYLLVMLINSNRLWRIAGQRTEKIIASIQHLPRTGSRTVLLNVPEEYRGALVFRNGLPQALLLNSIDTAGISIVGSQGNSLFSNPDDTVRLVKMPGNCIQIGERTTCCVQGLSQTIQLDTETDAHNFSGADVYYWNNFDFVPLYPAENR